MSRTHQRRQGVPIKVWRVVKKVDRRGNEVKAAEEQLNHEIKAWIFPQRSARGEAPGQLVINVVRIGIDPDLEGVELWSRVEMLGKQWDVVSPPSIHYGTRQVRHISLDLRERP